MSTINEWMERAERLERELAEARAQVAAAVEKERALQRQECAEVYRRKCREFQHVIITDIADAIIASGTNPTNPYGCRCEWKRDDHCNRHILWRGEVYFYSTSCDFCPSCGKAKRREQ
jgi:hypothetical protein